MLRQAARLPPQDPRTPRQASLTRAILTKTIRTSSKPDPPPSTSVVRRLRNQMLPRRRGDSIRAGGPVWIGILRKWCISGKIVARYTPELRRQYVSPCDGPSGGCCAVCLSRRGASEIYTTKGRATSTSNNTEAPRANDDIQRQTYKVYAKEHARRVDESKEIAIFALESTNGNR